MTVGLAAAIAFPYSTCAVECLSAEPLKAAQRHPRMCKTELRRKVQPDVGEMFCCRLLFSGAGSCALRAQRLGGSAVTHYTHLDELVGVAGER